MIHREIHSSLLWWIQLRHLFICTALNIVHGSSWMVRVRARESLVSILVFSPLWTAQVALWRNLFHTWGRRTSLHALDRLMYYEECRHKRGMP